MPNCKEEYFDWRIVKTTSIGYINVAIVSTSGKVTPPIQFLALKPVC